MVYVHHVVVLFEFLDQLLDRFAAFGVKLLHVGGDTHRLARCRQEGRNAPDTGRFAVCPNCGNLYPSEYADWYCPACLTEGKRFVLFE